MKKKYFKIVLCAVLAIMTAVSASSCAQKDSNDKNSEKSSEISSEKSSVVSSESTGKTETSEKKESKDESLNVSQASETEDEIEGFPKEWQDGGIFSSNYKKAYDIVSNMTTEEKIGQIILARCPATGGTTEARKYHLGGYVLFGQDFNDLSKNEIQSNIRSYAESQDIPMIIAVDEEGGTVSRLSWNDELTDHRFRSPRDLFDEGGIDAIISEAKEKNNLMKTLNINTNLAPVCDISKTEGDFMYDRSLGQNPDITADFVEKFTEVSQENGISVTLKHFPGYGNNADTHTGIAVDKRTYETFVKNDFIPFQAGIDAGAHVVLVSHNIVECMDKEHPASLSSKVHEILRSELGFTGIIVTDDLEMDAISEYITDYSPSVAAVLAGNDMLCVSDYEETFKDISEAVEKGTIEIEQIEHAAVRVIAWKMTKNLM